MGIVGVVYAAAGSIHDATESLSTWTLVGGLFAIVGTLALLLRRSDLSLVRDAKASLDRLVTVVESFRADLSNLQVRIAENYVSKTEFYELEKKLDKHLEHHIPRGERGAIED